MEYEKVYIIFDGAPGHDSPKFVEVEDERGNSVGGMNSPFKWEPDLANILPGREGLYRLGPFYCEKADSRKGEPFI